MPFNFNRNQYILSILCLVLLFVLGLQVNYNRHNDAEILSYIPKEALFLLELDIAAQKKNCLLGYWCFVDDQASQLLNWFENDVRHNRWLEALGLEKLELQKLMSKINNKFYIIGLESSENQDIELVFLTEGSDAQDLAEENFITKKSGRWLIFGSNQAAINAILARKNSKSNDATMGQYTRNQKYFANGYINYKNLAKWLENSNSEISKEIHARYSYIRSLEKMNFSAWFRDDRLNFSINSQDISKQPRLENIYSGIKLDPLFKLQPQIILDSLQGKLNKELSSAGLFAYFETEDYVDNNEHVIWLSLANSEKSFETPDLLEQQQILILPIIDNDEIEVYKNMQKIKLAYLLPSEQELILPSKEVVMELVADPSNFSFDSSAVSGYQMESLVNAGVDFETAFAYDDTKIIFADSKEVLSDLLHSNGDLINKLWQDKSFSDTIFYNFANQQKSYYGIENILIKDLSWGNNLWFRGIVE